MYENRGEKLGIAPLDLNDPGHPRFDPRYAGMPPEILPATESLAIVVDRTSETLVGASVVAPDASAAIHETVLAIHARIPVPQLASMLHGFPTTSRAFDGLYAEALKELRSAVAA